jgi:hypothetical protein
MAAHFTVYTPAVIAQIRDMRGAGKTSAEIARAIGTTPNSLGARMAQLGISKAKPQPQSEIAAA